VQELVTVQQMASGNFVKQVVDGEMFGNTSIFSKSYFSKKFDLNARL
jgi:hypothetical protein